MKTNFFFSTGYAPRNVDIVTLILRLSFGGLMAPHGYAKLMTYAEKKSEFMDFMGMGPSVTLALVIFAELFCSIFLLLGLFTRLILIPLIITGIVIVFNVHHLEITGDGFSGFAYLIVYLTVFLLGPGKYSIDRLISKKYNPN
jgi:putative oxidoreductase